MDQATSNRLAVELGFTPDRIQALRQLPYEQAIPRLEELKKDARSYYKKLVFQWHPDRNPNDSGASQKLADLSEVLKTIEGLKIQRTAPPPAMRVQYVYVTQQPVTFVRTAPTYSTSTSSATTATYHAGRVAFVRPV